MAETYKKHTHREHILELPDTYIGSCETAETSLWVYDAERSKMLWKKMRLNPGLYKIFDEILVNARDAYVRSVTAGAGGASRLPVKHIDVTVGPGTERGESVVISVENDGDGIPVEEHPTEGCLVPELIFGHLLTSSNYDKTEEKIVGGKNGYGAKLVNIFSTRFTVETQAPASGKKYSQTWRNNMSVCEKPSVRKYAGAKGNVKIEFAPDARRFPGAFDLGAAGGAGAGASASASDLSADMFALFHTRVIELAAMLGAGVKVTWNGAAVPVNSFEKYIRLFLRDGMAGFAYESCGPRWEVGAVLAHHLYSDEEGGLPEEKHISFVNGIFTRKGGKHVEYVSRHVLGDFCELAKKKKVDIKPGQIKDSVVFFVNATIVNPAFDSQTKECLTTLASKFGSTPTFTSKLPDGLLKLGLLDEARAALEARAARDAKKTDGKKRSSIRGLPKLEDALWAGTAKSAECTLILTEGDSAATSAISGLNVVGRERWGVFPLRGKLLNVKDITIQKFNANEELTAIKRILGLEHGKVYKSVGELRYGRVMIMADQDHDGSHIKGLVMNLFQTEWPALLDCGFLCTLLTPLLKASCRGATIPFYSSQEFEAWKAAEAASGRSVAGWHIKYYKGLGTSTPAEAREWFEKLEEIHYIRDTATDEALSLAFDKKRADDRKDWLGHYDPKSMLTVADKKATYSSFVHHELVHFSNAANIRALPHLMDGLKPSQRKILYSCLKRNLRSEIKVAQLAGYVSEHSAYHHGEASLNETIVGMAQAFVGSNNINLLKPIGQFGSRLLGGKDSASPRYIHTQLEPIVDALFRKEDAMLLKHVEDDGETVEPEYYMPVVPLLAINGCKGIGTGYSTNVPPYNPEEVVKLLQCRLTGVVETLAERDLDPWWFGFKGKTVRKNENTWITKGLYTYDEAKRTITIEELPVGTWTKEYKEFLDELLTKEGAAGGAGAGAGASTGAGSKTPFGFKNFDDLYNDLTVKFVLYFTEDGYDEAVANTEAFEKNFRLTTSWTTTNMHGFNTDFTIEKYDCIGDILESFVAKRLPAYEARRVAQLEQLMREITELEAKRAFIAAILEDRLVLMRKSDEEIVAGLKACGIPPLSDPSKADAVEGYDYVLRLRIDRVKASAVAELDEQVAGKRAEIAALEATTPAAMWLNDLATFEAAWCRYKAAREADLAGTGVVVAKKPVVRRKKVVGAGAGAGAH
jgi:DNA topoisomerase-2